MKRRAFLQFAAVSSAAFAAPETLGPVKRVTRLYKEAPASQQIRIVPDILALSDRIVALRRNQPGTGKWGRPRRYHFSQGRKKW